MVREEKAIARKAFDLAITRNQGSGEVSFGKQRVTSAKAPKAGRRGRCNGIRNIREKYPG
jgi:hypothetical protein